MMVSKSLIKKEEACNRENGTPATDNAALASLEFDSRATLLGTD